jgi:hypothetical protein
MAGNRTAPAFQEYAANMMAQFEYRTLTLSQRGLLYSMRLECWVNQFLPQQPEILARILGFDPAEIAAELPYVMSFFEVENGRITSPELESYRAHLDGIRERQAQGGKAGAAKTNAGKTRAAAGVKKGSSTPKSTPAGRAASTPPGNCRVLSTVQPSTTQPSQGVDVQGVVGTEGMGVSGITLSPDWEVDHGL